MADEKSEKAPSNVTDMKEEPPKEQTEAPPAGGENASMAGKSGMAPMNQGAKRRGGGAPCFGDCIVKPWKKPMLGMSDLKSPCFIKILGGEFLGTFLLVFFGIDSVITAHEGSLITLVDPSQLDKKLFSFGGGPNPNKLL